MEKLAFINLHPNGVNISFKKIKAFPLSNQSPDHTLEAVDEQQWFSTAGVWTKLGFMKLMY
jgi:hypothetical protein